MSNYLRSFFINLPTYTSPSNLSAVDTTNYSDGALAIVESSYQDNGVPQWGIFTFSLNNSDALNNYEVLASGGQNGRWLRTPEKGIVMQDCFTLDGANCLTGTQTNPKGTVSSFGVANYAGGSNSFTLTTTGSLANDYAFVIIKSYTSSDACAAHGVYAIGTTNPNQVAVTMDANPGVSSFYYVTLTPYTP